MFSKKVLLFYCLKLTLGIIRFNGEAGWFIRIVFSLLVLINMSCLFVAVKVKRVMVMT